MKKLLCKLFGRRAAIHLATQEFDFAFAFRELRAGKLVANHRFGIVLFIRADGSIMEANDLDRVCLWAPTQPQIRARNWISVDVRHAFPTDAGLRAFAVAFSKKPAGLGFLNPVDPRTMLSDV